MGLDRHVPFVALILALVSPAASADLPELPRGKGDACVAPTDEMRRDHMDFLLHQRDLTVHDGIRTPRFSLVEC
ncbi:MAG: sulfur reduction protein DsrJ, partial [Gammaproteobacteria bacterium]|nr:sulfur reduction protein DsrJ [Gammaproteobacteria bacterium]